MEATNFWQTVLTGVMAGAAIYAAFWAQRIGVAQNRISEASLKINNFAEVFMMPSQTVIQSLEDSQKKVIVWTVLVKNVSAYPIYLKSYTLNGVKIDIGNTPIPNNPESWYTVPIPGDVQGKGQFSLDVEFEDYLGGTYKSEGFGKIEGAGWNIHQNKRIEIQKNGL